MRKEQVRVRSAADNHVLRHVSEREARLMCAEYADGSRMEDVEPIAKRLSRLKAPLTDIRLLERLRKNDNSPCVFTPREVELNALVEHYRRIGPEQSMRELDAISNRVNTWPEVHDDRTPVICAGIPHGMSCESISDGRYLTFV